MTVQRKTLHQLFFPLFFETLFMMLAGMVDTLMLSSEGDYAVGAVGTANTYISLFIIMFSIISSGMVAVMTQYIGAKRPGVAHQALKLGLMFNLSVGVVITGVLIFGTDAILKAVGIARDLEEPASIYLRTIGAFSICNALTPILSSYLRSFGYTTPTMVATVAATIINVVLNGLFLFVMHWGVFGVALATGISRLVNLLWLCIAARYRIKPEKTPILRQAGKCYGRSSGWDCRRQRRRLCITSLSHWSSACLTGWMPPERRLLPDLTLCRSPISLTACPLRWHMPMQCW